jgi:hypothetical protein
VCVCVYIYIKYVYMTDHVTNEEVLRVLRVTEQRNILREINKRMSKWTGTFCEETAFYYGLLKEG